MRFTTVLVALFLAAPELVYSEGVFDIPNQLSLTSVIDTRLVQYRGQDGELWTLVTQEIKHGSHSQKEIESARNGIESHLRSTSEEYSRRKIPFGFERKTLDDGAMLVALGYEALGVGTELHSTLDFYIFWSNGSQVKGTIRWPGPMQGKLQSYLDRLAVTKLKPGPNNLVERDASPQSGSRPSPER